MKILDGEAEESDENIDRGEDDQVNLKEANKEEMGSGIDAPK